MKAYKEFFKNAFLTEIDNLEEEAREYNNRAALELKSDGVTLDEFLSFAEKVFQKFDEIGLPPEYEFSARYGFEIFLKWETHELSPLWKFEASIGKRENMLQVGIRKVSLADLVEQVQNAQKPHPLILNPVKEALTVYAITYSNYEDFSILAVYSTEEEAEEKLKLLKNNPIDLFSKYDRYGIRKYSSTELVENIWNKIKVKRKGE